MSELAILVPVLARPHRVRPLLESITASTPGEPRILFICDPHDEQETAEVKAADAELLVVDGRYPRKINQGVQATDEPLLFLAADDLEFTPGWLKAAKAKLHGGVEVVGVNDLIPRPREHATHFLMTRAYAERPAAASDHGPLHEGYFHWWVDDELIATARDRGAYAYAEDSHVRHLHPIVQAAPDDDIYRLGRSQRRHDRTHFNSRRHLWTSLSR